MTDTLGYIRVSTEQQATEQKTSLGDQRRLITVFATRLGRVLDPSLVFEDAGVSGATAEGRPAFMALLRYSESHPLPIHAPGMIVVLNDSRFGRFTDPEEATHWRFVLKRLGWFVRFVEGDEIQDPTARSVMRVIGSAQATEYRLNLKRQVLQGVRSHANGGQWQQEAPFGYRRLATRNGDGAQRVLAIGQRKAHDEVSRLTPGPKEEQEAIRWLFDNYAPGGVSLNDLTIEMVKRFPVKKWSKNVCRQVLHNPAYTGDIVWCRRVSDEAERKVKKVRDRSEWVVVRDAHPAIITREMYELVHQRMASNKRETTATQGGYPLAGLIRCAQCGNHFAGGGGKKGPPSDPDRYRFYRDTGNVKRIPECGPPMLTLRKKWIERQVIDAIIEQASDTRIPKRLEQVLVQLSSGKDDSKDRLRGLERERARKLSERKRLVDAIGAGTVEEAEAASNLVEIRSRVASIDTEIEQLRFAEQAKTVRTDELIRARELATAYHGEMRSLTGMQLRQVVQPWIRSARVDKDNRVLLLDLWCLPGIDRVLHLRHSQARD